MDEQEVETGKKVPISQLGGSSAKSLTAATSAASKHKKGRDSTVNALPAEPYAHKKDSKTKSERTDEKTKSSKPGSQHSLAAAAAKGGGTLSGGAASANNAAPPQGGAGGPGNTDLMAKLMAMMGKGGAPGMPDMKAMRGKGMVPPDMMAKVMGKSMPDMVDMMGKGLPDKAAIVGKGMPDMAAMMGGKDMQARHNMMGKGMSDMMAMMGAGSPSPMGMRKMLDCVIEVTFATPDSEGSEDDEDNVTIDLPCEYCSRFFTSQMLLKTHILVAHDHEDSSVLNIRRLVIDGKGKCSLKEQSRRKTSKDTAASAASSPVDVNPTVVASGIKVVSSRETVVSAAETDRGVKRTRNDSSKEPVAVDSGAASGAEVALDKKLPKVVTSSPPESRKRKARVHSQRSYSGDSVTLVMPKKIKSGDEGTDVSPPTDAVQTKESPNAQSAIAGDNDDDNNEDKAAIKSPDSAKPKKVTTKTGTEDPSPNSAQGSLSQRGKRSSRKDKEVVSSSDQEKDSGSDTQQGQSSHAAGCRGAVAADDESTASASRRSLRSRKTR